MDYDKEIERYYETVELPPELPDQYYDKED